MEIKTKQIHDIYLIKEISLEEIFESNEIDDILKENCFWNIDNEEENNNDDKNTRHKTFSRYKKHSMNFDRGTLVMKFLGIAIDKLKHSNKAIAKGLNWVKTEIQDKLLVNTASRFKKNSKMNNLEYNNIMSWIDENVVYNKEEVKKNNTSSLSINNCTKLMIEQNSMKHKTSLNSLDIFNHTRISSLDMFKKNFVKHTTNTPTAKMIRDSFTIEEENSNSQNECNQSNEIKPIKNFIQSTIEIKKNTKNIKRNSMAIDFDIYLDRNSKVKEIKNNMMLNTDNFIIVDESVVKSVSSKTFDIFQFQKEVGDKNCLPFLTYEIFFYYDLYSFINIVAMENFINNIRDGYIKDNPYHNDLHAADVFHTCYSLFFHSNVIDVLNYNNLDISAFYIGSIIHDYKHPGVTNGFLINTKDKLSIKYNGKFL